MGNTVRGGLLQDYIATRIPMQEDLAILRS